MSVQKMRSTYRLARLRLEQDRDSRLRPLLTTATTAFQGLVETLTKNGRLEDAVRVKNLLQALLTTPVTSLSAVRSAAGLKPAILFTNSLGMAFVAVPGTEILMCIHETRNADYAAYAASTPGVDGTWKKMMALKSSPDDDNKPVNGVSYADAAAFCQWLSKKEGRAHRLPTDVEWSAAVGIDKKEKRTQTTTPEDLSEQLTDEFPWGGGYPPQTSDQCGNYRIEGCSDQYGFTAPVMSFKPNSLGIYDLGGNVWEWVEDWFNGAKQRRTSRGNAWHATARNRVLSSARENRPPDARDNDHGIRVVTVAAP